MALTVINFGQTHFFRDPREPCGVAVLFREAKPAGGWCALPGNKATSLMQGARQSGMQAYRGGIPGRGHNVPKGTISPVTVTLKSHCRKTAAGNPAAAKITWFPSARRVRPS
jgi:hypothetical protein